MAPVTVHYQNHESLANAESDIRWEDANQNRLWSQILDAWRWVKPLVIRPMLTHTQPGPDSFVAVAFPMGMKPGNS